MTGLRINNALVAATLIVSIVGVWLTWQHLQHAKQDAQQ